MVLSIYNNTYKLNDVLVLLDIANQINMIEYMKIVVI